MIEKQPYNTESDLLSDINITIVNMPDTASV